MPVLGRARPVRPQVLGGWVEFVESPDRDAPAGNPTAAGEAPQAKAHVQALAGVATASGVSSGQVARVGIAAGVASANGTPHVAMETGVNVVDYASTPDHASLSFSEIDIRVLFAPSIWGADFLTNWVAGQWEGAGTNQWAMTIHQNATPTLPGHPRLAVSSDGSAIIEPSECDTDFTYGDDTPHWHRVTFDGNDGAGNREFKYYTSEDGVTWTQLGSTITTAGTVTVFNSTAVLRTPGAALWWGGSIYYLELRDGIGGTVVANPDFRIQTPGTTSFVDSTGKTWTLNGGARIRPLVAEASVSALAGVASASGEAGAVTTPGVQANPRQPIVATRTAAVTALTRYRRQTIPTVDLGAPLAQPETQAPAGVATADGASSGQTVQTTAPYPARTFVIGSADRAADAYHRQSFAAFVDLGAPVEVQDTNAPAGVASASGVAGAATADIDTKPGNPTAAGASSGQTVITGTLAQAGNPVAAGTAPQPEAEIGAKPGNPVAAGAADGQTVETGSFANAPAGVASASGTAFAASTTIRPNAAQGLAAGLVGPSEAEIGAKPGFGAAAGASTGQTVAFGALAPAGLATASGTALTGKADIDVAASVTLAAGVAGAVFGLVGNPTGPGQPVTVHDPPNAVSVEGGVGIIIRENEDAVEVR